MPAILVEPILTDEEVKKMGGSFIPLSHYKTVIRSNCDIYWNDNGVRRPLLHFRKRALPAAMMTNALRVFKDAAKKNSTSLRGMASGPPDAKKMSSNVKKVILGNGQFKARVMFKDGTVSKHTTSNNVKSLIAGYFDKPIIIYKHNVLTKGLVPCRTTAFTQKNTKNWETVVPMISRVDQLYKKFEPAIHAKQLALASLTPEFQIKDTAFSTVTVNLNWRTAAHTDNGDYRDGLSILLVAEEGKYKGGFLGFPRFGICVDVRNGDFLLMDPHQFHCNTEIVPVTKDYTRLSFVIYYRENIAKCAEKKKSVNEE